MSTSSINSFIQFDFLFPRIFVLIPSVVDKNSTYY